MPSEPVILGGTEEWRNGGRRLRRKWPARQEGSGGVGAAPLGEESVSNSAARAGG